MSGADAFRLWKWKHAIRLQRNGSSCINTGEIKKRRLSEKQVTRAVVSGMDIQEGGKRSGYRSSQAPEGCTRKGRQKRARGWTAWTVSNVSARKAEKTDKPEYQSEKAWLYETYPVTGIWHQHSPFTPPPHVPQCSSFVLLATRTLQ